ncbi:MAG TPA: tannase/feruloyl esterase family alpha/beta hydrolase [Croceibacterium sp.]|nr:tannase/feruloyl esterase family alpha/beta hydrolase [Croceibacterium sp.]
MTLAGAAVVAAWAGPVAAAECGELADLALPNGKVTGATVVAAGAFQPPAGAGGPPGVPPGRFSSLPAFCRVQATLTPSSDSDIKSEVWLPIGGWNGKYVGIGNGIWAGTISYGELGAALARGYAVAATDTGHTGNGLTAEWAIGHPEKLVDFGHRAVHETAVSAKHAIAAFYGRGPSLSLWESCSTGGRQGLMAAYRYPEDYDAISAMAPANPMTDLMTQSMWAGWQPQREPGAALSPPLVSAVYRAALTQCDKLDGLEDGLIGLPNQCAFDPGTVTTLSVAQADTMRALYRGPPGLPGWPAGSELQLAVLTQGQQPFPVALTYFTMLAFADRPGWEWKTFDYTADAAAGRVYGAHILDVPATGLGAFFARGGKLLMSHGWADGLIPANNSLRFHDELMPTLNAQQAADQYRLFMVPGMDHCGGGAGGLEFDILGALDEWATTGVAPDAIRATRPAVGGAAADSPQPPVRPAQSRPLCPYPRYARYNGGGDPNTASSFTCVAPSAAIGERG